MNPFGAIDLAAGALLVLAGLPKIRDPFDTMRAVRTVGLRTPAYAIRAGGLAEALLGGIVIGYGGRVSAGLLALSYAGFTAFVAVAMARGGALTSCGCVGRPDTPPTISHIVVTASLAVAAALSAAGHPTGLRALGDVKSWEALTIVGYAAVCTWLAWLALAVLPRLGLRAAATHRDGRVGVTS